MEDMGGPERTSFCLNWYRYGRSHSSHRGLRDSRVGFRSVERPKEKVVGVTKNYNT